MHVRSEERFSLITMQNMGSGHLVIFRKYEIRKTYNLHWVQLNSSEGQTGNTFFSLTKVKVKIDIKFNIYLKFDIYLK